MGQQQLILLVLATVIIGIAIVVGIRAFTENDAKANADALMQDAVRMASDIQAAIKKPEPFGGVDDFSAALNFGTIGYPVDANDEYINLNGTFTLVCTATDCTIQGFGGENVAAPATAASADQQIEVEVCGLTDTTIAGAILKTNGAATGAVDPVCVP